MILRAQIFISAIFAQLVKHNLWEKHATRSPKSFSERVFSFYAMYINQLFFVVKGQGRRRVWANRGAQRRMGATHR